jgi:hypothetical protein
MCSICNSGLWQCPDDVTNRMMSYESTKPTSLLRWNQIESVHVASNLASCRKKTFRRKKRWDGCNENKLPTFHWGLLPPLFLFSLASTYVLSVHRFYIHMCVPTYVSSVHRFYVCTYVLSPKILCMFNFSIAHKYIHLFHLSIDSTYVCTYVLSVHSFYVCTYVSSVNSLCVCTFVLSVHRFYVCIYVTYICPSLLCTYVYIYL